MHRITEIYVEASQSVHGFQVRMGGGEEVWGGGRGFIISHVTFSINFVSLLHLYYTNKLKQNKKQCHLLYIFTLVRKRNHDQAVIPAS